jgi:ectoine hydroxylase-related dioxygenase (phytanoyl-CoA dioxygenase family)
MFVLWRANAEPMTICNTPVSEADIARFQRDGAVCLRNVFAKQWIELAKAGIRRNVSNPGKHFRDLSGDGASLTDMYNWRAIPEYAQLARESPAAAIAGELMSVHQVIFIEEQFFSKRCHSQSVTPWHQDIPYYPLLGTMCSVWIPLSAVATVDCLELIAGSHRTGKQYLPIKFLAPETTTLAGDPDKLPDGVEVLPDIEAQRGQHRILAWDVEPGDCIVFDAMTVHGNRGNQANTTAERLALRFGAQGIKFAPNKYPWVVVDENYHYLRENEALSGENFPLVWKRNP